MDVLRAQRREYNDLYRAHQATTTQDALKMDMMLSLLAAQNAGGPNTSYNPASRRENYYTRTQTTPHHQLVDTGLTRRVNPKPNGDIFGVTASAGLGHGPGGLSVDPGLSFDTHTRHDTHPTLALPALNRQSNAEQMAALFSGSRQAQNNNVYNNSANDGFRYRSPVQPQFDIEAQPTYKTVADYEFAQRRRAALLHDPGICAQQVLESPVDAWGLQAILLKIRASSHATNQADPWHGTKSAVFENSSPSTQLNTPVDGPALDVPTPTKTNVENRLSIPSAASDESAPAYDYFAHDVELPLTPTTSAYSDAYAQQPGACIIRVSGAGLSDADIARLAQVVALLVSQSPLVLHAAFTACEELDDEALGSFVPSERDISVKLLFAHGSGDHFANASEIFHRLGGCILVKGMAEYALEDGDEAFVSQPQPPQPHPARRARRWRGLVQDGIVPPMREQMLEQRAAPQPVDRFAQQLRAEYGVDVAALAR